MTPASPWSSSSTSSTGAARRSRSSCWSGSSTSSTCPTSCSSSASTASELTKSLVSVYGEIEAGDVPAAVLRHGVRRCPEPGTPFSSAGICLVQQLRTAPDVLLRAEARVTGRTTAPFRSEWRITGRRLPFLHGDSDGPLAARHGLLCAGAVPRCDGDLRQGRRTRWTQSSSLSLSPHEGHQSRSLYRRFVEGSARGRRGHQLLRTVCTRAGITGYSLAYRDRSMTDDRCDRVTD